MTEVPEPATSPTSGEPAKPPPPPLRPINLAAATLVSGVLVYNLHLDAASADYHGAYVTYGLIVGVCLSLGLDIEKFWPKR